MADKLFDLNRVKELLAMIKNNFVMKESGKGLSTNDYTTQEKEKLATVQENAQPNQNAFGKVTTGGGTWASADNESDLLTLVAGDNMRIDMDTENDKFTFHADVLVKDITSSGAGRVDIRRITTSTENGDAVFSVATLNTNDQIWGNRVALVTDNEQGAMSKEDKIKLDSMTPLKAGTNITIDEDGTISSTASGEANVITKVTGYGAGYCDYVGLTIASGQEYKTPVLDSNNLITPRRLPLATTSINGAMSSADKVKLDAFGSASEYAKQSDVNSLSQEIANKQPKGNYALKSEIPSVDGLASETYVDDKIDALPNNETLIENVAEKVPYVKVAEQPTFVNSIAEMTDTSKMYVLNSDAMFYSYKQRTITTEGEKVPNFTNLIDNPKSFIKDGYRWSLSGGTWSAKTGCAGVVIPFVHSGGEFTIRMRNAKQGGGYKYLYLGSGNDNAEKFTSSMSGSWGTDSNGDDVFIGSNSSTLNGYVTFTIDSTVDYSNIIVTLNEEITYTTTEGGTQVITEWSSTGISYNQPADYESRVIANERNIENLKSRTSSLENQLSSISISSNGTTVFDTPAFAPVPQLPADGSNGADFNVNDITTQQAYDYMDILCNKYKQYITKQTLGKDESGNYDYNRYVLCMSYWKAWQRENYPRMFAWKNGSTIIYSVSVSPRVGDSMYSTPYIGTVYKTVTSVNCTAGTLSTRTVNGLVFTRHETGDVEPTIVYMKPTYYKGNFEVATVYDSSFNSLTTVSSVGNGYFVGANGIKYTRYPFEDRKADKTKPFSIFLLANEHGGDNTGDSLVPSIATMRLAKDLCKNTTNPFLQWLKGNAMITMIPVGNPYGYPMKPSDSKGYYNFNGININRNYDTPGWATSDTNYGGVETFGEYAGSENETQYIMNTMRLCKPKVGISMHGLGFHDDDLSGVVPDDTANAVYQGCGFDSSRMPKIAEVLYSAYGVGMGGNSSTVQNYNSCGKSPAYIQYVGATGGLIEISSLEACTNKENTSIAMEQAYTQILLFLQTWCEEAIEKMS